MELDALLLGGDDEKTDWEERYCYLGSEKRWCSNMNQHVDDKDGGDEDTFKNRHF